MCGQIGDGPGQSCHLLTMSPDVGIELSRHANTPSLPSVHVCAVDPYALHLKNSFLTSKEVNLSACV